MEEGCTITAIGGRSTSGGLVHATALLLAAMMFVYLACKLQPLFNRFIEEKNWGAVSYLVCACLIIPSYWPYAAYRLLLLVMYLFLYRPIRRKTFKILDKRSLPPVSIVIAMRNEPASMVINLIESLRNIDYPDYEIVIADNSDIITAKDTINKDLIEIVECAERYGIRVVRRDCGSSADELDIILPASLCGSSIKGEIRGGKAGNLNAALASAKERYKWFFILDSDSSLPDLTLRQMVSIGVQSETSFQRVGFVQSILTSANPNETSLSNAQSVIDEIYYNHYFMAKAAFGVVSNWGHGILVSKLAWQATQGFPLEISEDLAWANELLLLDKFENYYALCPTSETKPATWNAFRTQRNRWAKGTTIQLRKQLVKLWRSERLLWSEKMDLTYDMTSYVFNAIGCLLPLLFICSSILGSGNRLFFQTLVPAFYVVMAMDNLLVPLESARMAYKGNISMALKRLKAVPFISVYLGAIASQTFIAVVSAFALKNAAFNVTPKRPYYERESILSIIMENKFCYLLFVINGWIALNAWSVNPIIVPLLCLSPIGYFFAPLLGNKWEWPNLSYYRSMKVTSKKNRQPMTMHDYDDFAQHGASADSQGCGIFERTR